MPTELPTPEQILEELADRAIGEIDRRAPVSFESALKEMTRYHRFLLALHAASLDSGPISYAEISGDQWRSPHSIWAGQYRRLFDRAAERLADDTSFIEELAFVPSALLQPEDGVSYSPAVQEAILDLEVYLAGAIGEWVAQRSMAGLVRDDQEGHALRPLEMRALKKAMPRVVGAWESVLDLVPSLFAWGKEENSDAEHWERYRQAWPFLRQHLANTAYALIAAVWNGDEVGAKLFRETLMRWPDSALLNVNHDLIGRFPWLLQPGLFDLGWENAREQTAFIDHPYAIETSVDGIFAEALINVKHDIVVLIASLLLTWSQAKASGSLVSRTIRDLIRGVSGDAGNDFAGALDFATTFQTLMRLQLVGERYERDTYGAWLDEVLRETDNMRGEHYVPGRVHTPTTVHDREQLTLGNVALLLLVGGPALPSNLADEVGEIAKDDRVLPRADGSLRAWLTELDRYQNVLRERRDGLIGLIAAVDSGVEREPSLTALRTFIGTCVAEIEKARQANLANRPVDDGALEEMRAAAEAALMKSPAALPYFEAVEVYEAKTPGRLDQRVTVRDIEKAYLVRPAMDNGAERWTANRAKDVARLAASNVMAAFADRPRKEVVIENAIDESAFWLEVSPLAKRLEQPVILLPAQQATSRLGRRFTSLKQHLPGVEISYASPDHDRGYRIAIIEGIEVFSALQVPDGRAWLFSANHLRRIGYRASKGARISIGFIPSEDDPNNGALEFGFQQRLEWGRSPVFDIRWRDDPTV